MKIPVFDQLFLGGVVPRVWGEAFGLTAVSIPSAFPKQDSSSTVNNGAGKDLRRSSSAIFYNRLVW
ncbi:MAG: hypothetical protein IPP37_06550 [Saprospiraceae bacterium]|nr:hypothetical protein [Saprospiraceae bacterium]